MTMAQALALRKLFDEACVDYNDLSIPETAFNALAEEIRRFMPSGELRGEVSHLSAIHLYGFTIRKSSDKPKLPIPCCCDFC